MNESFALVLQGLGTTVASVGGKAHALDRLIAIGAPVPPCGVLTTGAYREFVATPSLAAQVAALRVEPLPAITTDNDARRRVDEMFLEAPMPPSVRLAIENLVATVGRGREVAIRSSATAEDLGSVSFAGQYRSFLDVQPADVERAVRLTWASLWHPVPRAYRLFHSVDERDLAMALIVMPMLTPIVAGVAFTRDPGGVAETMRVELVHGLGEALVSGALTPEAFIVDRAVTNVDLASVAEPLADLPLLAADIERELGAPQDLEWAVDRERLWILQARPITADGREGTDDGFDTAPRRTADWTTAGIAEMLPGILPPRLWELNSWLVEDAFRQLFFRLGGDVGALAEPNALLARHRARAALDLDAMRVVISSIPGGSTAELEHQYFGDTGPSSAHQRAGLRQNLRLLQARSDAAQESEIVVRVAELVLDGEPDLASLDDDELLALAARVRDLAARAMASEVAIAAMAAAAYRAVESLLARQFGGDQATHIAQRITGSHALSGNPLATALTPLLDEASRDADLSLPVRSSDPADRAKSDRVRTSARYRELVRRAGSRSICGGATWEETPEQAWAAFEALLARRCATRLDEVARCAARTDAEDMLHREPHWQAARAAGGMFADPRRAFLRREADDAAELLERRERVKAAVLMIGGVCRRIDLEIGRRLVDRADLRVLDDVDLLTFVESARLLRHPGGPPGVTPAMIAGRRRRLRSAELNGPLPRRFWGRTAPAAMTIGRPIGRGWGASPGRYEGVARFVESPASVAGFRRGDVLVARTTDASWMPLFLMAGAIVVEDGGPLSHAAIVARELGVPTIMNVPGIVDRLVNTVDAMVTVDGTTGEIVLHDDSPDDHPTEPGAGLVPARIPPALDGAAALHVFVTGLIGASALVSVVMSLTERLGCVRGRVRLRTRAEPIAHTVSAAVLRGFDEVAASPTGLRSRRWYATMAALLLSVAVAVGARSGVEYWQSEPGAWRAVLTWSASTTSSLTLAAGAIVLAFSALRWPAVAPPVRRFAAARARAPGTINMLQPRIKAALTASLALAGVLAVLVITRWEPLNSFDRWLYGTIHAGRAADRYSPDWMNAFGQPIVVIPLAVLLAVVARHCRALALMIPTAIVATGVTVFTLTWLTMRERPVLGSHAGEQNSFPGGHVAQLTLLFGLLPLVIRVVTGRRWLQIIATATSSAILVTLIVDTVRTGGHWPTDQVAGFLLAAAVLAVVTARFHAPACHVGCGRSCPMKGEVDEPDPATV